MKRAVGPVSKNKLAQINFYGTMLADACICSTFYWIYLSGLSHLALQTEENYKRINNKKAYSDPASPVSLSLYESRKKILKGQSQELKNHYCRSNRFAYQFQFINIFDREV